MTHWDFDASAGRFTSADGGHVASPTEMQVGDTYPKQGKKGVVRVTVAEITPLGKGFIVVRTTGQTP